jgi:hypothetical protein
MQTQKDDRSLGELFGDLARDMGVLVRQEVGLATTEMTHKAARMARNVAVLAVGGLVAYAGVLAMLAAIIVALAVAGLGWWQAAALVGVVVTIIGVLLVQRAIDALKRTDLTPTQTVQTLKEDTRWAKEQMS